MLLALLTLTPCLAQPTAEELSDVWARNFSTLGHHAKHTVLLDATDFKRVAEGKIAKRRLIQEGPDRAIGVGWTPHSRDSVWIAIIDEVHNTMVNSLYEQRLGNSEDGAKRLYQRLDLPWPFHDRQWVISISNNTALADATNNDLWERYWRLDAPIDSEPADPDALWIPTLDGAWIAVPIDGGTLLVYQARTTIGGAIPDELVTRWAMSTLDEMLMNVFSRAAEIPHHYDRQHERIVGGDGKVINLN